MANTIFDNLEEQKPATPAQVTPGVAAQTQQSAQNPAESTTTQDPYAAMLAQIQAEDGRQKYATTEDALKSVAHAQNHIKELTDKLKELEQKVNESESVDEIVKRLESKKATGEQPSKQELDETKLAELLDQQLTKREKVQRQEANQQDVVKSLVSKFGDKAEEAYKNKAKELGVDVSILNDLARTSPRAVLEYFGMTKPVTTSGLEGKSSVNTAAMDTRPRQETDPMARFRSSDSELLHKWRAAASKIEA